MAEPNAQQLARQKLANTDLAKFAPPQPKRKNAEPEPPKYTTPAVKTSAEKRKAHKKAYAHTVHIAKMNAKIEELEADERRLKSALWIARAKRAIEKIAWFKLWNASISTMNPEDGARQEYDKWKKNLGKFLKKAEKFR